MSNFSAHVRWLEPVTRRALERVENVGTRILTPILDACYRGHVTALTARAIRVGRSRQQSAPPTHSTIKSVAASPAISR